MKRPTIIEALIVLMIAVIILVVLGFITLVGLGVWALIQHLTA